MNIIPTAITVPKDVTQEDLTLAKQFSGQQAGICYMPQTYAELAAQTDTAISRFQRVTQEGHHSVAEHVYITVLFESCSKLFAMLLNNVQAYNTSEKSGRYTIMGNNDLYKKWLNIFDSLYKETYPQLKESLIKKLSMENARYIISVLDKNTTFSYTTSIRMWNYILNWSKNLIDLINEKKDNRLSPLVSELSDMNNKLSKCLEIDTITDIKSGSFDLLLNFDKNAELYREYINYGKSHWGLTYSATYASSFVALAQLERHRTIKYHAMIPETASFYIPSILHSKEELKEKWIEDAKTVVFPGAQMLDVIEIGDVDRFLLKCTERLCGAAQEEIQNITISEFKDYYFAAQNLDWPEKSLVLNKLQSLTQNNRILTKCEYLGNCSRPCSFMKEIKTKLIL